MSNSRPYMIDVTYAGLWALYEDVALECERIEQTEPSQRPMTDKLSLPYLFKERARLWDKITSHPYAKLNRHEGSDTSAPLPKE